MRNESELTTSHTRNIRETRERYWINHNCNLSMEWAPGLRRYILDTHKPHAHGVVVSPMLRNALAMQTYTLSFRTTSGESCWMKLNSKHERWHQAAPKPRRGYSLFHTSRFLVIDTGEVPSFFCWIFNRMRFSESANFNLIHWQNNRTVHAAKTYQFTCTSTRGVSIEI